VALFGKPKQLKNLERQLTAARMSFAMFERLPAANQRQLLDSAPRIIANAVTDAIRAGHAAGAQEMLDDAARQVPKGATQEQWQTILMPGLGELPSTS
jgi:hypothetical protein